MLLLPPHSHTERERKRGTRTFTPFCCFASDQRQQLQLHCNWNGLWGKDRDCDWGLGRDLVEVLPAGLATSNIYKQIKFASEFHLSCFATIVCECSVCVCAAAAAKLLGLPSRVKVKLYLYFPVAKSEITSEMHAECARP